MACHVSERGHERHLKASIELVGAEIGAGFVAEGDQRQVNYMHVAWMTPFSVEQATLCAYVLFKIYVDDPCAFKTDLHEESISSTLEAWGWAS